jgi:pimeloyl-ACP methyl ester carboxylesterase
MARSPTDTHPTWLFLHGTPLDAGVWNGVRTRLFHPSLAPELTDLVDAPTTSRSVQRGVADAVLARLPHGRYHVVGHSLGGQVALELAFRAPELVEHLVILCSRHTPFPAFGALASEVRADTGPDVEQSLARWFTTDELEAEGEAVRYARSRLEAVDRVSWSTALDAIATYEPSADISVLSTPTTALCAGLDKVSSPDTMADLAAALPHGSLHVVDEWAHMSPFVDPNELAQRLESTTAARF